jgi:protein-S-isoprenylcysteine O-methyltransferase Ste14
MRRFFPVNILIIVLSLLVIAGLQFFVHGKLQSQAIFLNSLISYTTVVTGAVVLLIIWWVNRISIRNYVSAPLAKK